MSEVILQSVVFRPDDLVEISYIEPHEQNDHAGIVRTAVCEQELVRVTLDEVLADCRDLLDEVLVIVRNPPKSTPLPEVEDDNE